MKSPLTWITCIAAAIVLAGLLFPTGGCYIPAKVVRAHNDVNMVRAALIAYRSEYGILPAGDHRAIVRSLLGDNQRKIVFLEFNAKQRSPEGDFLDPWGSAYRIDTSDLSNPTARSPGKDKKDEPYKHESDDICSWR